MTDIGQVRNGVTIMVSDAPGCVLCGGAGNEIKKHHVHCPLRISILGREATLKEYALGYYHGWNGTDPLTSYAQNVYYMFGHKTGADDNAAMQLIKARRQVIGVWQVRPH